MRNFTLSFFALFAMTAVLSCTENEGNPDDEPVYDDVYYAAQATIGSDYSRFTSTDEGGTIKFMAEGGEAVINVSCEVDWIVDNEVSDLFETVRSVSNSTLTITAEQNYVEEELSGDITFLTAAQGIEFAVVHVSQNAYGAPEISVEPSEWHAPAVGELSTEIAVESSLDDFTFECNADWLIVEKTDTGISITADENLETDERKAEVTVTVADAINSDTETIDVIQDGKVYLILGAEELTLNGTADEASVYIESNLDWDYEYESNEWLNVSREGDKLVLTVTENDSEDFRESIVIVTAGDGAQNVTSAQINVTQYSASSMPMILLYTTSSRRTVVTLPFDTGIENEECIVDCTVDWGDGSEVETVTSTQPSHTYEEAGNYTVLINGTVTSLSSSGITTSTSKNTTLTAVKQWGKTGLKNMYGAFQYYSNLTSLPEDTSESLSEVTNFAYAFYYCAALKEIPTDLFAYATKAESFNNAFGYSGLTSIPEGLFDNCTIATDFGYVFYYCKSLVSVPYGLFTKCTNAESFEYAFYYCNTLTSLPDDLFKGMTKARSFDGVLGYCTKLAELPNGLFAGCVSAETFEKAFYYSSAFTAIPTGLFDDCSNVTSFASTFSYCTSLTSVPENLFDNCIEVKSFQGTFTKCSKLTGIPDGLFDNCEKVTSFAYVFQTSALTSIPTGLFDNCVEVEDFSYAFDSASLTDIPENLFVNNKKAINFSYIFRKCSIKKIPSLFPADNFEGQDFQYMFYNSTSLEEITDGLFNSCVKATTFARAFASCSALKAIPADLFANCPLVTSFSYLFDGCKALTDIPKGLFDNCPAVKDFSYLFDGCTAIKSVPDGFFDNNVLVEDFSYLFDGCTSFNSIPDGLFDKNVNVQTFSYVFYKCTSLSSIPDGLFDNNPEVTNFYSTFYGCTGLTEIPSGLFSKCKKITNVQLTFNGCTALKGESPYDVVEVDGEDVHVHLYERGNYSDYATITTYTSCFKSCTGLTDYSVIPTLWGGGGN